MTSSDCYYVKDRTLLKESDSLIIEDLLADCVVVKLGS